MKLINITNHRIIPYTTSVSCKEYYIISDELVDEIEGLKYVVEVDPELEPELELGSTKSIDLNLIEELVTLSTGDLFDTVETIIYKNRDLAVIAYNEMVAIETNDKYFRSCKYVMTVEDFSRYNKSQYRVFTDYTDKHPYIFSETYIEDTILKAKIYLNIIHGEDDTTQTDSDWAIVNNAVYDGTEEKIFKLEINNEYIK